MGVSEMHRAKLHAMLDELINEGDSLPGGGAFLFIRETLTSREGNHTERALHLRGYLGKESKRLRELVRQLRTIEGA